MSEEIIYLIEVAAYTGSAEEIFRFCTGVGFTSTPTDTPANTFYEPRVEHPGLFRQDMFSPGATSGGSTGGYGEIVLINTDGGLDSFIDYGFDGRRCVVKQGYASQSLAEFATVITGTVEQAEVSWSRLTLRLKDRSVELDVTLQDLFYAGDNALPAGIEGTSELKDKPKPLLYGKCNNVSPVMVNTSKLIYQICSNALSAVSAVYDNGVILTAGAAYTNQADMEANAPDAGEYRVWLAGGCFRLGSSPAGTITADAVQGAADANRTAGQIIKQVVVAKLGTNQIVEQSIIDLDAAAPYVVGYYTGPDNVTAKAALDTICASVGAWWGFDNSGLFWSKQLTPPYAEQSLMTLTEAEILSLGRTATADSDKGLPIYKVNLAFSRNWTVQNSGLAGSISTSQLLFEPDDGQQLSTDRRNLLAMEYIRTSASDTSVQTKHLLAPEITVQTTIDTLANANTEASRLLALRKVRRDRLNVKIPIDAATVNTKSWDNDGYIKMSEGRYGHSSELYDDKLIVIGGYSSTSGITNNVTLLNLSNKSFTWDDAQITNLPESRYYHTSLIYSGYLYVIGGIGIASVKRLNLSNMTGSWESCRSLPLARHMHTSHIYGGFLYVLGGSTSGTSTSSVIRLDMSDPINNTWDDAGVTDMPSSFWGHDSCLNGSVLYVSGGTDLTNALRNTVYRIDLASPSGSWVSEGTLPYSMCFHKMFVFNNYLCVICGFNSIYGNYTELSRCRSIADTNGSWASDIVKNYPTKNHSFSMIKPETYGKTIIIAGNANTSSYPDGSKYDNKTVSEFKTPETLNLITDISSLGRTVTIQYPRYGYDAGRPMKIIGVESDHQSRQINLELWG